MEYVTRCLWTKIDTLQATILRIRKMSAGNEEFTAEFFNESSKAWMANKIRAGQSITYKCQGTTKDTKPCKVVARKFEFGTKVYCRIHASQGIEELLRMN
jgi:hypothetical protein